MSVLGSIGDRRAVDPLLEAYRDLEARKWPGGWSDRRVLAQALGRIGDPRARAILKKLASKDPIKMIKNDAAAALERMPPK